MNDPRIVTLDLGFSRWKGRGRYENTEQIIPHALVEIPAAKYNEIMRIAKGRPGADVVCIDIGRDDWRSFVVGHSATRAGAVTRLKGAARYKPEYIGVAAAVMFSRIYRETSWDNITVMIAHPPRDVSFVDDLIDSVRRSWRIKIDGETREYNVTKVATFPELLGGLMNVALNETGDGYADHNLKIHGDGYVLDIGGHTIQGLPVHNAKPDFAGPMLHVPRGIDDTLADFEAALWDRYGKEWRDLREIPAERLRKALRTNILHLGGRTWPCDYESDTAANVILNDISGAIQEQARGAGFWDFWILTGGGAGALNHRLIAQALKDHPATHPAAAQQVIDRANMRGGRKIALALGL